MIRRLYVSIQGGIRGDYSRFTNLQGRIGLKQLERLEVRNRDRDRVARAYRGAFSEQHWRQMSPTEAGRVFHFYVARARGGATVEEVRRGGVRRGVDLGIGEELTHDCSFLSENGEGYPQTSRAFQTVLQLPLYDGMSEEVVSHVAGRLAGCLLAKNEKENRP
jgi:dTDP-4-amino-4,6-dideoxygalactose transaminase